MTRPYRLRQRGEAQRRTRQKIIEAAMDLHQTKGLAATSMSDIAERAKLGRVTVYRHFPDVESLTGACSGLYFQRHPLPDPAAWRDHGDGVERLQRALRETYAYHRETEPMLTRILAEARDHPVMRPYHDHWRRAAEVLVAGWALPAQGQRLLKAAVALALSFDTWRYLVREQALTDDAVVRLMVRLTGACQEDEG